MEQLRKLVAEACQNLFGLSVEVELTRPNEQFGDYATNVALQLAGQLEQKPVHLAEQIVGYLQALPEGGLAKAEVAGPGFINLVLSDEALAAVLVTIREQPDTWGINELYKDRVIVIEHTDPNPFKEFHIGHAYSNTIGESLGRLFKIAGGVVHQVSYHGDAGMHIAMAIWGIQQQLAEQDLRLEDIPETKRHTFLGQSYAIGAQAFAESGVAQGDIKRINKQIYERDNRAVNRLYDTGRQWSFAYFETVYKRLGVSFERQYFETETGMEGVAIVREHLEDGIFEESDGAIVYRGEKVDLHTRVFITGQGLPTYEAKELGLAFAKEHDYHFDQAVVVTANEIDEYFRVLLAALGEIDEALARRIRHVSHGVVRLPQGKMSSRSGKVIAALEVLDMLEQAIVKNVEKPLSLNDNVLGALKYAFLKHRIGGDIVFDVNESISLEGNSGPYLQYAHARAHSILAKASSAVQAPPAGFKPAERSLLRKIHEYPEVIETAVRELTPHLICTYLYELAQNFNRFYEQNRVIDDPREALRLQLVEAYAATLKNGLNLLNIPAPDKM